MYNPYLTKITSNRFMLIWKNKKTLYVQEVNGDGELVGKKKSYKGYDLTCCEPVYANGKIQWYKTENKKVHFYYLNCTEQLRELSQPKISTFEKEQNGIRIRWEKVCVLTDDTAVCYEDDSMECGVWYTYSIAIIVSGVEGDFDKSEKFSACKENAYSCSIREKMK